MKRTPGLDIKLEAIRFSSEFSCQEKRLSLASPPFFACIDLEKVQSSLLNGPIQRDSSFGPIGGESLIRVDLGENFCEFFLGLFLFFPFQFCGGFKLPIELTPPLFFFF